MPWSLGFLGDFVWLRLPEARPFIAKGIVRRLEDAIDSGGQLIPLTAMDIASEVLRYSLLLPAFERYPADREALAAYLGVVHEAYAAEHPSWEDTGAYLKMFVLEWLAMSERLPIVEELHPELFEIVKQYAL